jgi:hypothetical protein
VVNDKVWAKVTFDNLFTTVAPSTETEETETEEAEIEETETADESVVTTEE